MKTKHHVVQKESVCVGGALVILMIRRTATEKRHDGGEKTGIVSVGE